MFQRVHLQFKFAAWESVSSILTQWIEVARLQAMNLFYEADVASPIFFFLSIE